MENIIINKLWEFYSMNFLWKFDGFKQTKSVKYKSI